MNGMPKSCCSQAKWLESIVLERCLSVVRLVTCIIRALKESINHIKVVYGTAQRYSVVIYTQT